MPNEIKQLASALTWAHGDCAIAVRAAAELVSLDKQNRQYEKALKGLVISIESFLELLDRVMKSPSTEVRGKQVAQLCNRLDISKDNARFFGLDIDFRTGKKRKPANPKPKKAKVKG